jgi:hypothetical protein
MVEQVPEKRLPFPADRAGHVVEVELSRLIRREFDRRMETFISPEHHHAGRAQNRPPLRGVGCDGFFAQRYSSSPL